MKVPEMSSKASASRTRVLVVTPDVLGVKMAGPAIRAWEMARALHRLTEVRLVSTQASTLANTDFLTSHASEDELRDHIAWADVLVFQGHILSMFPWICDEDIIIVADIYDPMHLETLEQGKDLPAEDREALILQTTEVLNVQLERADFMLCASEKQRDFWLGQLGALCRINPHTYDADPSLRNLIDIAPFGISDTPADQTRRAIKGTVPGIGLDDEVIIWGGGVYNWFDPLTLIRAVALLVKKHPKLRLYFLGVKHPNPLVPAMRVATETMLLSSELGLTDEHVFFNTEWVEYDDRVNYLLDADLGVSTHFEHVETAFSFRTRILDYLWAGLPIVATEGDTFASIIRDNQLGTAVPPEDVEALADAIENVLYSGDRDQLSENSRRYGESMTWSHTLRPLLDFCQEPHHAADYPNLISSPRQQVREHMSRRIEQLEGSTSWRMTRPLRSVSKLFRGR